MYLYRRILQLMDYKVKYIYADFVIYINDLLFVFDFN